MTGLAQSEARGGVAETLEAGLGSVAKLKILRLMLGNPEHAFTLYELEKRISVKPVSVRKHIVDLKGLGWVEALPYTPKKYKANLGNFTLKRVLTFFESTGYI
ncbi:hypothetical protein MUP77_19090 [Candidatus Bathyarchaeota archaeon]|nr:hypothetical protein [Candidatus Bathyarchaeota archaeon]